MGPFTSRQLRTRGFKEQKFALYTDELGFLYGVFPSAYCAGQFDRNWQGLSALLSSPRQMTQMSKNHHQI